MMTTIRAAGLPILALMLAACTGPRVVTSDVGTIYSTGEFFRAADGRDLRTVVQGNLFGQPGFDRWVAEVMTGTYVGPRTRFTPTPGPTARPEYFVSVVFNPQPDINPFDLCKPKQWATVPAKRPVVVRAAFCILGGEATAVAGYLDQVAGPDDPNLVTLIRTMTMQLFPYTSPFDHFRSFSPY